MQHQPCQSLERWLYRQMFVCLGQGNPQCSAKSQLCGPCNRRRLNLTLVFLSLPLSPPFNGLLCGQTQMTTQDLLHCKYNLLLAFLTAVILPLSILKMRDHRFVRITLEQCMNVFFSCVMIWPRRKAPSHTCAIVSCSPAGRATQPQTTKTKMSGKGTPTELLAER